MHLSADGPSWFQPMDRRQVMAAGAASMMRLGLGPSPVPSGAEGTQSP
ncbi:hypothetical protein [Streptomyces sp. NBRC 110028]|nr:hypothetical protein [Streptomyces sp. NBRC 110028]